MGEDSVPAQRTPARRKARQLARHLRGERPDYAYLKEVFRHLRDELGVEVATTAKKLPYVPAEAEIRRYYQTVWTARRSGDIVLIKTLLYTGVRVAELVAIRLTDADLDACRIRITNGKGGKDRYVPFSASFRETLALHIAAARANGAVFVFESSWKKPYSTRGVRAMLARYARKAGLAHNMPPTGSGTSCSPGSKPKASTMPSSSPTPATPPAPRWKSTAVSPCLTPRPATTASSANSPCRPSNYRTTQVTRRLPGTSWYEPYGYAVPQPGRGLFQFRPVHAVVGEHLLAPVDRRFRVAVLGDIQVGQPVHPYVRAALPGHLAGDAVVIDMGVRDDQSADLRE
jgi:integrase/recombinase XerD